MELDAKESEKITEQRKVREAEEKAEEVKEFDWETAERAELKGAFI